MMKLREDEFLIEFAIRKYNRQFNRSFTRDEFTVRSITPRVNTQLGYEFTTKRFDDFVRLRVYFNFGRLDDMKDYRLEVNHPSYTNALGDETFVAFGTIDRHYLDSGTYRFRWLGPDFTKMPIFVTEDGFPMVDDQGRYFHYVIGTQDDLAGLGR